MRWHSGCGLGSGYTHTTAVKDAEQLLQHAVDVFFEEADHCERRKKGKNACRLATRLLRVRIRFLKALITQRQVFREEDLSKCAHEITSLKKRLASLEEEGVAGILREFSASEAFNSD